jgi:gamma-glutamyltranspeptidase/glutathione hydrolase
VADPAYVDVPLNQLLSDEYASNRALSITTSAFEEPAPPGSIEGYVASAQPARQAVTVPANNLRHRLVARSDFSVGQDTSQLVVVDPMGNAVVITPSDFPKSPMLPDFGINLGDRMTQFRLDPDNVNVLAPGKRPRVTPHSVIVFKDGRFHLALSTPGGDMQAQALVQVFLNLSVFAMSLQDAISSPRFYSINSPSSFSPHERTPAGLRLEKPLYKAASESLRALGYDTLESPRWDKDFGAVGAILKLSNGGLLAAADPREETTAAAQ